MARYIEVYRRILFHTFLAPRRGGVGSEKKNQKKDSSRDFKSCDLADIVESEFEQRLGSLSDPKFFNFLMAGIEVKIIVFLIVPDRSLIYADSV